MSAKTGSDAPQKSAVAAGLMKPMLISLDFSALITAIEEQNNRIEMLEMQLRKKDEEVAALTASVTVLVTTAEEKKRDDLGLMVKGLQQREVVRDKKLDDMAVEQAKLDKRIAEEKVTSDIRFQKGADGLGDAVKRVELLEEFLPTLTLRSDHEKLVDAVDDFRSKQGRQATSMQQAAKVTQEAVDDLKTRALPQLQRLVEEGNLDVQLQLKKCSAVDELHARAISKIEKDFAQMNETMGGNIGALRAVLKETGAEITSTHNLSHALVQNQRRFGEEFSVMRDAAATSIVDLQRQARLAAAQAEEQRAQFEMGLRELDEALRQRMEKVESNVIKPDGRCLSCLQVVSSSAPSATYSNPQLDRARSKSPPLSQSQATLSFIGPDTRSPPARNARPGSAPIRTIQQRKEQLENMRLSLVQQRLGGAGTSAADMSLMMNVALGGGGFDANEVAKSAMTRTRPQSAMSNRNR